MAFQKPLLELSHFEALAVFAFFTSLVFSFLSRKKGRERMKYFAWTFLLFLLVAISLGWLMYPFPR